MHVISLHPETSIFCAVCTNLNANSRRLMVTSKKGSCKLHVYCGLASPRSRRCTQNQLFLSLFLIPEGSRPRAVKLLSLQERRGGLSLHQLVHCHSAAADSLSLCFCCCVCWPCISAFAPQPAHLLQWEAHENVTSSHENVQDKKLSWQSA